MNTKNVIEVVELVKKYKKAESNAVDGISFPVKKGEFFALLGPNGAGKTTTISILTTTLAKTSGQVNIAGYDLDKQASRVRANIGVIFQNPSLDQNLTAEENIRFHSMLYGLYPFRPVYSMMPTEYKKKVNDLAEILGIQDKLFAPIKTFSGGMKRKLEIIRSLVHDPKVLFLDEPTSGLDPLARADLWKYLLEVKRKEKITIFLTTHYLEEAEDADYITIIDKGKIISKGTPSKIKHDLVEEYVLVGATDRKKLLSELKKLKLKFDDSAERIRVDVNGKSSQKIIHSIKTPLSYLNIHNPTLEEAYIQIVNQQNGKHNA
jgi:ABC-2 type transport system ATP-binding protein